MGNRLTNNVVIGTIGELPVQTRLLQYGVQAAAPIKDSGNDLIAVKEEAFRGIQVKTTVGRRVSSVRLPERYHIVAVVYLVLDDEGVLLDESEVYLVPRAAIEQNCGRLPAQLDPFLISQWNVDRLFQ